MKYIILLFIIFITSCGSSKIIPTSDVCTIKKHWRDSLYQVKINGQEISKQWLLKKDALEVVDLLAKENKCMSR